MYRSIDEILTAAANRELPHDVFMLLDDGGILLVVPADKDLDGAPLGEPEILWTHEGDPLQLLARLLSHVGVPAERI